MQRERYTLATCRNATDLSEPKLNWDTLVWTCSVLSFPKAYCALCIEKVTLHSSKYSLCYRHTKTKSINSSVKYHDILHTFLDLGCRILHFTYSIRLTVVNLRANTCPKLQSSHSLACFNCFIKLCGFHFHFSVQAIPSAVVHLSLLHLWLNWNNWTFDWFTFDVKHLAHPSYTHISNICSLTFSGVRPV